MRTWSHIVLILMLAVLCGCVSSTSTKPPRNWVKIDTGKFAFMAPPKMKSVPVKGIDSFIGAYQGDSINLHFDYGKWSNPLEKEEYEGSGVANFTSTETFIDGKQARIISCQRTEEGNPLSYEMAVHFPAVEGNIKLTFFASCKTSADLNTTEKIFHTIKFNH